MFQRGDIVEVAWQLAGDRLILVYAITLPGRGGTLLEPAPRLVPFPGHTAIMASTKDAEITAAESQVIGRTAPGPEVRVEVVRRIGVLFTGIAGGTVFADQSGIFVCPVRSRLRTPGSAYTTTVTPTSQGHD